MKISGTQISKLAFEIKHDRYKYTLDASDSVGGEGLGPSPKGLLLSGLIGCTGIDVAMILKKMRVTYERLDILAETELTETEPTVFKDITLTYRIRGDSADAAKIQRAVSLSMNSYCGVSAMLEKNSRILPVIYLNDRKL